MIVFANLDELYVTYDKDFMLHLCKIHFSDSKTGTTIRNLNVVDEVRVCYYDYFDDSFVSYTKAESVKNISSQSFKTLLDKYGISRTLGINDDTVPVSNIMMLWEWLSTAMILENYDKQLKDIEIKRKNLLEHQELLIRQRMTSKD